MSVLLNLGLRALVANIEELLLSAVLRGLLTADRLCISLLELVHIVITLDVIELRMLVKLALLLRIDGLEFLLLLLINHLVLLLGSLTLFRLASFLNAGKER